ncbi:hypothetical protein B0H65DRAFT_544187 [Neurospora tetraspora]|uniref:Uncharacterized protein n=1 Tax=Neurospora tetraspora TaxID=94610 RepID=A0AAE0JNL7_9PEZI|nr:hypothetical protein B0H65DRAFT_544187 [Neurospora tetraspora]
MDVRSGAAADEAALQSLAGLWILGCSAEEPAAWMTESNSGATPAAQSSWSVLDVANRRKTWPRTKLGVAWTGAPRTLSKAALQGQKLPMSNFSTGADEALQAPGRSHGEPTTQEAKKLLPVSDWASVQ